MKYLTFLDYPTIEATSRNFEEQLKAVVQQKDKEIEELRRKVQTLNQGTDQIKELQKQIVQINQKIGKQNPYDLTEEIENYKQENTPKRIKEVRDILKRERLKQELIEKGVPVFEAWVRTLPKSYLDSHPEAKRLAKESKQKGS